MTTLHHYDNLGTARFVTFSCNRGLKLFTDDFPKRVFLKHLKETAHLYDISILSYVIMPEHVHLVLYPRQLVRLGHVIGEVKSLSAREIIGNWRNRNIGKLDLLQVNRQDGTRYAFWQKRCYDHNCRTIGTVREKINYCHKNPVTRGLVKNPEQWIYSSYRWYEGMEEKVIFDIDGLQM